MDIQFDIFFISHNAIVSNLYYQVAAEKPNPIIFLKACELLGVKPEEAVHVGDDRRNDIWGARDAGCDAWLWGSDVRSFKEVFLFILDTFVLEVYLDSELIDSNIRAWSCSVLN